MCLPKDLAAFIHFAQSKRFNPKVLKAVSIVNEEISRYCATNDKRDTDLRPQGACKRTIDPYPTLNKLSGKLVIKQNSQPSLRLSD
jgi:hypothetical protein